MKCSRCKNNIKTHTMSVFNTDIICIPCSKEEKTFDSYTDAVKAENEAVKAGNFNYPGIGLNKNKI